MMEYNPKLDLNVDAHIKFGLCQFFLKILSRNEILTSLKGLDSIKILSKMAGNNHKLDLVNVDVPIRFSLILSSCFQDIEPKHNSDVNQGL